MNTLPSKQWLQTQMQQVEQIYRDFVASLTEQQRAEVGTMQGWSAKDELSHCLSGIERLFADYDAIHNNQPLPDTSDYMGLNEQNFQQTKDTSWADTIARQDHLFGRANELSNQSTSEELERPFKNEHAFWKYLLGMFYEHPMLHLAIYKVRRGDAEWGIQHYERMVNTLANLFPEDIKGEMLYNTGCILALASRPEAAMDKLTEAVQIFPAFKEYAQKDTDLQSIWELPAFKALVAN